MKIEVPQQDRAGRLFSTLQFIVFLAMMIGIYLFLRRYVHAWYLRLLCLIADYIVCALISYCVLKPLSDKAAESMRKRQKK